MSGMEFTWRMVETLAWMTAVGSNADTPSRG
jgi:hypothetical protein